MATATSCKYGWKFLLANMTILLPAAVGIMDKFHIIAPYLAYHLIVVLAIVLNVVVISPIQCSLLRDVMKVIMKKGEQDMTECSCTNPLFEAASLSILAYLIQD